MWSSPAMERSGRVEERAVAGHAEEVEAVDLHHHITAISTTTIRSTAVGEEGAAGWICHGLQEWRRWGAVAVAAATGWRGEAAAAGIGWRQGGSASMVVAWVWCEAAAARGDGGGDWEFGNEWKG